MKKKGSALIIAMFLIAGVGAVAFGIGRLLFIETGTATLYENGVSAYYAAESGIEEGFLRYKFDRNAMVPTAPNPDDLLSRKDVYRTNLTGKSFRIVKPSNGARITFADLISDTEDSAHRDKQFYDLNMSYLGTDGWPWYGNNVVKSNTDPYDIGAEALNEDDLLNPEYATGDYSSLEIKKDSSVKIDLTEADFTNQDSAVMFFFPNVPPGTLNDTLEDKCKAMVELKLSVDEGGLGMPKEYKELTSFSPIDCASELGIDENKLKIASLAGLNDYSDGQNGDSEAGLFYSTELVDFLSRAGRTFIPSPSSPVTLTIRPLNYNVKFGVYAMDGRYSDACDCSTGVVKCKNSDNDRVHIIPGPFTSITSRGYYGGVTRTITANIDRQSGTLYDLFDYVIFKEN